MVLHEPSPQSKMTLKQTSVNLNQNVKLFIFKENAYRLQNIDHFVSVSMC